MSISKLIPPCPHGASSRLVYDLINFIGRPSYIENFNRGESLFALHILVNPLLRYLRSNLRIVETHQQANNLTLQHRIQTLQLLIVLLEGVEDRFIEQLL